MGRFFPKRRINDKSRKLAENEPYDPETAARELAKNHKKGFRFIRYLRENKSSKEIAASILGKPYRKLEDSYRLATLIAEGGFGRVYECWDINTNKVFAIKKQAKAKIVQEKMQKAVLNEMLVMQMLDDCPNIMHLHDAFEDQDFIYFVTEFCQGGDILDRIMMYFDRRGLFTEAHAASLIRNMLLAVKQCHDNNVIHRDIKPENFLLLSDDVDGSVALKLTDFGLSAVVAPGEQLREPCGTPHYVAPEVWDRKPYSTKVDVWALGVCLTIILTGRVPFGGEALDEINLAVHTPINFDIVPWRFLSRGAVDLARRMLQINTTERISIDEALDHPWVREDGIAPSTSLEGIVKSGLKALTQASDSERAALRLVGIAMRDKIQFALDSFDKMDRDRDGHVWRKCVM